LTSRITHPSSATTSRLGYPIRKQECYFCGNQLRSGPQTENNINRAVMARSQIPGRMNPIDLGNCRDLAGASLSCAFITSPLTLLILCHPLPIIIMSSPSPKRRDSSPAPEPAKKRRRGATRLSCAECRRSLLITPLASIPLPNIFVLQIKASLRSRDPLWLLRQARLWGHLSRW
jgi:hypothetical protein